MQEYRLLGECRTLWGEREQAACILATEERMRYQNVSKTTSAVGSLWWHIVSTSLAWHITYSIHCHTSIIFSPSFLVLIVACLLIPSQGRLFPVNVPCNQVQVQLSQNCISMMSVQFHMLHVIFHESVLRYGVNDQHL